ncbi:predicted GPI-anchored protein 58 [Phragmites australis]|uniref:predicted GPI-anchored protein 58 n=1 Tax=Phragmites australis TaxID=29695 RepID=UPI002D77002C|nr:predicted GPI-anchored protein 58 [Phragmites australis]
MAAQGVVVSCFESPATLVFEVSISSIHDVSTTTSILATAPTPTPAVSAPRPKDPVVAMTPTPALGVSAPTLEDPIVATAPTPAPVVNAPAPEDPVVSIAPTSSARPLSPNFDALSTSNEAEHDPDSGSDFGFGSRFKVCPSTATTTPPSSPNLDAKR